MAARPVVIVGAGGHGREVHEVLMSRHDADVSAGGGGFEFLGFVDDGTVDHDLLTLRESRWLGTVEAMQELSRDVGYVIGIGDPAVRRRVDELLTALGFEAVTLIHPAAYVGRYGMRFGPGCVVFPFASLTSNVTVGRHCHVNLNAVIGHDSVIGDYVTVSPNAVVSGGSRVGAGAYVGAGSVLNPQVQIGTDAVVGAGAVVVRDVADGLTVAGVPARPLH